MISVSPGATLAKLNMIVITRDCRWYARSCCLRSQESLILEEFLLN